MMNTKEIRKIPDRRLIIKLKRKIKRLMPASLRKALSIRKDTEKLRLIQKLECDITKLPLINSINSKDVFSSSETAIRWSDSRNRLDAFTIPDLTDGINPGDRRAIYYLISKFKPSSVLEIGTHIGASTLHIAEALFMNKTKDNRHAEMVSVDIADVNNPISKPWLQYGTTHSPLEMINEMEFGYFVEFIKDTSLHYLSRCERKFDFIFLDGNHASNTVYLDISYALKLLNKDGLILLHDYFPDVKSLWSNGVVIPGPFLATERFREEGADLEVLPLGGLPWPTKLQSNVTSLALLLGREGMSNSRHH